MLYNKTELEICGEKLYKSRHHSDYYHGNQGQRIGLPYSIGTTDTYIIEKPLQS